MLEAYGIGCYDILGSASWSDSDFCVLVGMQDMNGEKRKNTAVTFLCNVLRDLRVQAQSNKAMHEIVDSLVFLQGIARDTTSEQWEDEKDE